jgi:hypothetical protein
MKTIKLANAKIVAFGVMSLLALAVAIVIIPARAQDGQGSSSLGASSFDEALLQEAAQEARPHITNAEMVTASGPGLRLVPATEFRRTFFGTPAGGWFENGYIHNTNEGSTNEFIAPVRLPDGALIRRMTAYIYDNAAYGTDVWFLVKDYTNWNSYSIPAYVGSTSQDAQVRPYSYDIPYPERVDNSRYMYYVLVRLYSVNQRLYTVNFRFSYDAFVPATRSNVCTERLDGRETEPNDNVEQANWICPGVPVNGSPNDAKPSEERDYFTFKWNAVGTLQIDLTNFLPDGPLVGQLILRKNGIELTKDYQPDVNNNYQVTYNGAAGPGKYDILVFGPAGHDDTTGDYTLAVTIK